MRIHELKTVQPYFFQIANDTKKFEIRKNDRNFKVGDYVLLREYDVKNDFYTNNNSILIKITYILDSEKYCKEGYITFGFKIIEKNIIYSC